jgi:hypothetical protein
LVEKEPTEPVLFYHDFLADALVILSPDGTLQMLRLSAEGGDFAMKKRQLKITCDDPKIFIQEALVSAEGKYLAFVSNNQVFIESLEKVTHQDSEKTHFFRLGSKEPQIPPAALAFHPIDTYLLAVMTSDLTLRLFNLRHNIDKAFLSISLKAHAMGSVVSFAFCHALGGKMTSVEDLSLAFLTASGHVHVRFPILWRNEKVDRDLLEGLNAQVARLNPISFPASRDIELIRRALIDYNKGITTEGSSTGSTFNFNLDAPVKTRKVCRLDGASPLLETKFFDAIHNPRVGLFFIYAGLGSQNLRFSVTFVPQDGIAYDQEGDQAVVLKSLDLAITDPNDIGVRCLNDTLLVVMRSQIVVITFDFLKRLVGDTNGKHSVVEELVWHLGRCVQRIPRTNEFDIIDAFPVAHSNSVRVLGYNSFEKCVYFANLKLERPMNLRKAEEEEQGSRNGTGAVSKLAVSVPEGLQWPAKPTYNLTLRKKNVAQKIETINKNLQEISGQIAKLSPNALERMAESQEKIDKSLYTGLAQVENAIGGVKEELAIQMVRQNELAIALSKLAAECEPKREELRLKREKVGNKVTDLQANFKVLRQSFIKIYDRCCRNGQTAPTDTQRTLDYIRVKIKPRVEEVSQQVQEVGLAAQVQSRPAPK